MNKIGKKLDGIKRFISILLVLVVTISMNPRIEILADKESEPYDNGANDILWVEEDTAMHNADADVHTSMDIVPAEFTGNAIFIGYFKLLDKYGYPLAGAPWELREGFYKEGYNGSGPVNITYGDVLISGTSDADGYITINNSSPIAFNEGYACTYLLVQFPDNTIELSAEGLRTDSNDGSLDIHNAAYLTYQSTRFHPFQLDGYTLVGRSATLAASDTAATTYGKDSNTRFVIGVIGEFSVTEKYESIDNGGTLLTEITTTKLTAGSFSSAPPETITSGDSSYSWQGYYLDDEATLRTDYPVMIDGIYDNHTVRHQYAGQYTLSFNTNGGSAAPSNQALGFGVKATAPAQPTKPGFDFMGWYEDNGIFSRKWDFNTNVMPADSLTLYAKWQNTAYTMTVEYMTRDGVSLGSATNHIAIHGGSFTAAKPGFANYVLVDWKLGSALQGDTSPTINPITGAASIALIYGQDRGGGGGNNPDGTEDITITKNFETTSGTSIQNSQSKYVNMGEAFDDEHDFITGYTYLGYKLDGGALNSSDEPNFTIAHGDSDKTVTYVYQRTIYTITIKYETRSGMQLSADTTHSVAHGESFIADVSDLADYMLADWKLNGAPQGNIAPAIGSVTGAATITLVYGQDKGGNGGTIPDGIEDITITKKFLSNAGASLLEDQTVYVNMGETFADRHDPVTGYTYQGYKIGSGLLNANAEPSITPVAGDSDKTVTYMYGINDNTVTVEYVDREGNNIHIATSFSKNYGEIFNITAPAFYGYIFVDWRQDGGLLKGDTNPGSFTMGLVGTTIALVYGQDKGGNGGTVPDGIEDITITKKFESNTGALLQEDQTVYVNIGETFDDTSKPIAGYTYEGYKIDSGSLIANAEPNIMPVAGDSGKTVTYVYAINSYSIEVKYETRTGGAVTGKTNFQISKNYHDSYAPTAAEIAATNYVLVSWKLDGTLQNSDMPSILSVTNHAEIILIYGQDKGGNGSTIPDGIEDITVTKKFESSTGSSLQSEQTVYANIGQTFDDGAETIAGWIYDHFHAGGTDSDQYAVPSIIPVVGDSNITVTYVYVRAYTITVKYETQDGVQLSTDTTHIAAHGSSFAAAGPAFANYALTGWKIDDVLQSNINPAINPVTGAVTVTLVYSPVGINPGTEYFTITEKHQTTMGDKLKTDVIKNIAVNTNYVGDYDAGLSAYSYKGYKLNGAAQVNSPQKPNIANVSENHEVVFVYSLNQYLIHVTNQYEDGSSLTGVQDVYVAHGQSFTADILTLANKTLINWKLDGIIQNNTFPRLTDVIGNHDLVLIYGSNGNGGGGGSGSNSGSKPIDETLDIEDGKIPLSLITTDHIKYISGYPDGTVRIDQAITRAEAASIFFLLLEDGNKYGDVSILFHDVDNTGWYSQAVNYLSEIGVVSGYPDGTFRPNETITRAEYATMASKFSQLEKTSTNFFSDVQDSHWARDYINSAFVKGWVVGYGDNTFRPAGKITRAEVVAMTNKVLGRKANHEMIETSLEGDAIFTDLDTEHWSYYDVMEASVEHAYTHDDMDNEIWTKVIR